jgi:sortase A
MPISRVGSRTLRSLEWLSYVVGVTLAAVFAVQVAQSEVDRQSGVKEFQATAAPDTTLWAPGRIDDYRVSLEADLPEVLGILAIPSVNLEVPIYPTDSELIMDRGAGIVDGMSYPHEGGNIGIAGHRDGYFRVLKDISVGDKVILETLEGPKQFTVNATEVVEISDTHLLQDTTDQTVTLVTCYPFYFVGHAPKRFIVTASLDITDVNQL